MLWQGRRGSSNVDDRRGIGGPVAIGGGIIGVITTIRETSFLIRTADKSILEIARSAVADIDHEDRQALDQAKTKGFMQ